MPVEQEILQGLHRLSPEPSTRQEGVLTWLVLRKLDFCVLQPFSDVPVQAEDVRRGEVDGDIKFSRDPVHKLELLRVNHEDLWVRRESGSPAELRLGGKRKPL